MIEQFIDFIVNSLLPFGALGVFLASVLEEVIAPIPSALVMMTSGFIFVHGYLSVETIFNLVFKVALPAALGVTLGSYVIFFASKYGGKMLIDKWGKYLGLYWDDLQKMEKRLSEGRREEVIIGISRITPFIPSVAISAFCGFINMNIYKYFLITFTGTFVRGLILGVVGWQVGNVYQRYAKLVSDLENVVFVVMIILVLVYILYRFAKRPISTPHI